MKQADTNLIDKCYVCGKAGRICEDLTITGDKKIVHVGNCHDRLIARDRFRIDKELGLL
tara:strand:- start:19675 stop:19851 length:177 start_codon:yes stop_codon:yes gene_type:complete